jgi:cytochrome oxidase Cu insertion factor (SCO1/SenC/PrrC family)
LQKICARSYTDPVQFFLAVALLAVPLIPIHGVTLGHAPGGLQIVRTDPVTGIVPAQTRAFRVTPKMPLPSGTGIDAYLDRSVTPWRLYDTSVAAKFIPGLPETGRVIPLDYGFALPHTQLVDQRGRAVDLASSFRGKLLVLSFIFTRCPDKDECPAVSGKFADLQKKLDPAHFHLAEITLDPMYDSPWVLRRYGSQYGARPAMWSLLTAQPHVIRHLLDRFGISSMHVSDAAFLHNDKVFLITPDGKIADIIQGVSFAPDALAAQAEHLAGMSSNPIGRIRLALVAGAAALCGGSQFAGVVLLETSAFLFIATCSLFALSWIARKIWRNA